MAVTQILKEQVQINSRLADFGITKDDLWQIVKKVVAARNDAISIDPVNAPGLLSYIYGTRATRELFLRSGWSIDRANNVESTLSPDRKIKIIYQNAETASNHQVEPQSISPKGAGSAKLVEESMSDYLFPYMEEEDRAARSDLEANQGAVVWFLFVSIQGERVTAELSCPEAIFDGHFRGFLERIFIVKENEWNEIMRDERVDDPSDHYDIDVVRKR